MANRIKPQSGFFYLNFYNCCYYLCLDAGVAKLVDAPDLGSGALGRVGSSPITRTKNFHILQ